MSRFPIWHYVFALGTIVFSNAFNSSIVLAKRNTSSLEEYAMLWKELVFLGVSRGFLSVSVDIKQLFSDLVRDKELGSRAAANRRH